MPKMLKLGYADVFIKVTDFTVNENTHFYLLPPIDRF